MCDRDACCCVFLLKCEFCFLGVCAVVFVSVRRAAAVKMLTAVNHAFSPQTPNPHFHCGHPATAAGTHHQNAWSYSSLHFIIYLWSSDWACMLSRSSPLLCIHTAPHIHTSELPQSNQPTTDPCCKTFRRPTNSSAHKEIRVSMCSHQLFAI